MDFDGLELKVDEGNLLTIDPDSIFKMSRIYIQGTNNEIILNKALVYQSLFINFKGNNKKVIIQPSKKNISNLKIVSIRGEHQLITIGIDFSCGGCEIQMNDGNEALTIGDDCLFSWGIKIRTSDGHSIIDLETGKAINLPQNVSIGNHVWVGEDVKFLKGVTIPDNCVVGSGAIVTKKFIEQNTIIAGLPAKVMRSGISWSRKMPYEYNSDL